MINDTDGRKTNACDLVTQEELPCSHEPVECADCEIGGSIRAFTEAEIAAINERHETELVAARGEGAMPAKLNETEIADACMSYNHEYGLLGPVEQSGVRFRCQEWYHSIRKTICEPTEAVKESRPDTTYTETIRATERAKVLEELEVIAWGKSAYEIVEAIRSLAQNKE